MALISCSSNIINPCQSQEISLSCWLKYSYLERGSSAVECRTRNQVRILLCYRFEDWAFSFSPLWSQFTQLYKWVPGYRQWWTCDTDWILRYIKTTFSRIKQGNVDRQPLIIDVYRWRTFSNTCFLYRRKIVDVWSHLQMKRTTYLSGKCVIVTDNEIYVSNVLRLDSCVNYISIVSVLSELLGSMVDVFMTLFDSSIKICRNEILYSGFVCTIKRLTLNVQRLYWELYLLLLLS